MYLLLLMIMLGTERAVSQEVILPKWTFDIFQGQHITSKSFDQSTVQSSCECRRKCFIFPQCKAWSVSLVNGKKQCDLADHFPIETELMNNPESILGVNPVGSSAYMPTTTPPPTNNVDPTTYENRYFKEKSCSKDRVINAVSMKPMDNRVSYLMYTQCFRAMISPAFTLDVNAEQLVSTGPNPGPSEACTQNKVLIGFKSFAENVRGTYNVELKSYDNPPFLVGICHLLQNWFINYDICEDIMPTNTPWTGKDDASMETGIWDYWFSCNPFYLTVQVTREMVGDQNQVTSIRCCKIEG